MSAKRAAFTLLELLIVIAIIGILIALLLPAIQRVRESAARTQCASNMKQLGVAVHMFHQTHKVMPTYNGIFPTTGTMPTTLQGNNPRAVYGSWFVHLMPFIEQDNLYGMITAEVAAHTNTGGVVTAGGGALITAGKAAVYDYSGSTYYPAVPAKYDTYTGSQQWVGTTTANGYTIYTLQWVPPKTPDPGTGIAAYYSPPPVLVSAKIDPVYGPPGAPVNGYVGVWNPDIRTNTFQVLQCPSDPSANGAQAGSGHVYTTTLNSGLTNYLANWNAFTTGDATWGYQAPPSRFAAITDGQSNTIFFGEGYAWCEGRGRIATLAWQNGGGYNYGGVHNFGITYSLGNNQIDPGSGTPVPINSSNGFPNPTVDLNFTFQIRPNPLAMKSSEGCNVLTAQTGHEAMNVVLGDGSVRSAARGMDPDTWYRLMKPNDGEPVGDW